MLLCFSGRAGSTPSVAWRGKSRPAVVRKDTEACGNHSSS